MHTAQHHKCAMTRTKDKFFLKLKFERSKSELATKKLSGESFHRAARDQLVLSPFAASQQPPPITSCCFGPYGRLLWAFSYCSLLLFTTSQRTRSLLSAQWWSLELKILWLSEISEAIVDLFPLLHSKRVYFWRIVIRVVILATLHLSQVIMFLENTL